MKHPCNDKAFDTNDLAQHVLKPSEAERLATNLDKLAWHREQHRSTDSFADMKLVALYVVIGLICMGISKLFG